ncbi:MAG: cytochrome c oxidase subunit II [Minwuia sp.]|uniref:cytochrome c oxidase subunit II n=1 Tax=Minwuia sp. TaxID=2493630 RepID=UPI003A8AD9C2
MRLFLAFLALVTSSAPAFAELGHAAPGQLGMQEAASPLMEEMLTFHNLLLVVITLITLFVLGLLIWVMVRFNERSNPVASKTSHNTLIEVVWTVVPILILLVIAIPSFKLLINTHEVEDAEMTLKATGYQWYWGYEYPDHGGFSFDAIMKEDDQLAEGELRLLTTDNLVVLPVQTKIRVLVTAADVGHSWAMPATGGKVDGWPGHLNELPIYFEKEGMYYGQCSELCGRNHGFMPIQVKVVSKEEFAAWVEEAKVQFGAAESDVKVAAAERR